MIDHKLGVEFPEERRDELWLIQQKVERRRAGLVLWQIVPGALRKKAQGLAADVVRNYASVLNPAELDAFFGIEEVKNPNLPTRDGD